MSYPIITIFPLDRNWKATHNKESPANVKAAEKMPLLFNIVKRYNQATQSKNGRRPFKKIEK